MEHPATRIARELAGQAERVCRAYLSNGRREGNYWLVGDARNTPGRSCYVRLRPGSDGASAGKWTDAESGEHGDLLDIIRAAVPTGTVAEALEEARQFLSLPDDTEPQPSSLARPKTGSPEAARRLLAITRPLRSTLAQTYLGGRGIALSKATGILRFHPRIWYRRSRDDTGYVPDAMPAMIAPVTDCTGTIVGAHRTWLRADGTGKAPVANPRRAMGHLLGNGVRFGPAATIMAAGEGIESALSLVTALPAMPTIAALSAAHLAAIEFPPALRRLYVARERDFAGRKAFARLAQRGEAVGIEVHPLDSERGDLNADLLAFGPEMLADRIEAQMLAEDRSRQV